MNIKQKIVAGATAASMALTLLTPFAAHAAPLNPFGTGGAAKTNLGLVGADAGISTTKSLPSTIGTIINIALSLLGIVFLGLALYAGFQWMTAGGDSKAVDSAKGTLQNAIVGLIVIMASYALSSFVIDQLFTATNG